jgi:hypothetical protein
MQEVADAKYVTNLRLILTSNITITATASASDMPREKQLFKYHSGISADHSTCLCTAAEGNTSSPGKLTWAV